MAGCMCGVLCVCLSVDRLANSLAGRVDVVCCMVDRICTGRELTPTEICVTTEPDPGA